MIINQELVKKVKEHFNLNIYETKVWLALLSKGVVSAGETAEMSGVPRSRTYDVLEGLAKRGFAIVKVGKPVKYIAVEPKTVLERMKTNTLTNAQEKVKTLSDLKNTTEYSELVQLHKTGINPIKIEELSGHIKGRSNILSKIKELIYKSEKDITIHTTIEDFESKSRVLLPILRTIERNNKINLKISLSGESHKIKRFANRNSLKIKETKISGKFFLIDRKEVLFMIHSEKSDEEIGVWINSPFFTNSFNSIFERQLRN
jgi:HTH-type transcriptional regulator, sugar sensing transcriptional regulator